MSSTFKAEVFVLRGDYNEESRQHPGLAFMEVINKHFDSRDHSDYESLYTEDFAYRSTHGHEMTHEPGYHDEHSFTAAAEKYYLDPLEDHEHFLSEAIALSEKEGGYSIYWMGDLYAHVKGQAEEGEAKVKDRNGKEWDVMVPVSYHFEFVPDKSSSNAHGYKMANMKAWKDTAKINDLLDRRSHGHLRSIEK